ncbi:phosphoinositide 3-kinase regulatory subunit 4 [Anaeramoeba flamelloides]|uniref:non-specific serine/threonine protein kinase n=1 Tax=Anaeramoeba flamelloides TaxID=1746091 RepID=A0ABQ8YQ03_9EUKA|nr:phosphoinositide 3-kinase regulatory subunit 4 [Anaeramoeba flamelloides]
MGNHLLTNSNLYFNDLEFRGFTLMKMMQSGRFLKNLQMMKDEFGIVVVKVFTKHDENLSLKPFQIELERIYQAFQNIKFLNVLPFQQYFETKKAGYLIRPYLYTNLADKLKQKPFLQPIEKKFLVYQLLHGVNQLHSHNLYHGDLKSENIVLTSFLWIFITDLATYKPKYIPAGNPAKFSYYFDTSGTRKCYLAPERFYDDQQNVEIINSMNNNKITREMDLFSLGCIISELYLDGEPLFSLSELLQFREKKFVPVGKIKKIKDLEIRGLVNLLTQLNPKERGNSKKFKTILKGKLFPEYFNNFMFQFIGELVELVPNKRIRKIYNNFEFILSKLQIINKKNLRVTKIKKNSKKQKQNINNNNNKNKNNTDTTTTTNNFDYEIDINIKNIEETKELLNKINIFSKEINNKNLRNDGKNKNDKNSGENNNNIPNIVNFNELNKKEDNLKNVNKQLTFNKQNKEGLILICNIITSSIRAVNKSHLKIKGLEILGKIAFYLKESDLIFDRIVPYIIFLFNDPSEKVKMYSIKTLYQTLEIITDLSPLNYNIFSDYILPSFNVLLNDTEISVKRTIAKYLPKFSTLTKKFFNIKKYKISKTKKNLGFSSIDKMNSKKIEEVEETYGSELYNLRENIFTFCSKIFDDQNKEVIKALLINFIELCEFLRVKKTIDLVMRIINSPNNVSFLSSLMSFFDKIVIFVGKKNYQHYLFPLMEQFLTHTEEIIVEKSLFIVSNLVNINFFSKKNIYQISQIICPLIYHPNIWINYLVINCLNSFYSKLKPSESYCFLNRIVQPFLKKRIEILTDINLLNEIKLPLSRKIFLQTFQQTKEKQKKNFEELEFEIKMLASVKNKKIDKKFKSISGLSSPSSSSSSSSSLSNSNSRINNNSMNKNSTIVNSNSLIASSSQLNSSLNYYDHNNSLTNQIIMLNKQLDEKKKILTLKSFFLKLFESYNRYNQNRKIKLNNEYNNINNENLNSENVSLQTSVSNSNVKMNIKKNQNNKDNNNAKKDSTDNSGGNDLKKLAITNHSSSNVNINSNSNSNSNSNNNKNYIFFKRIILPNQGYIIQLDNEIDAKVHNLSYHYNDNQILIKYSEKNQIHNYLFKEFSSIPNFSKKLDKQLQQILNKIIIKKIPEKELTLDPLRRFVEKNKISQEPLNGDSLNEWKPEGRLVATFNEHKGKINSISVSSDNMFFITSSDDGTVKIWDTQKIYDLDPLNQSQLTYSEQGGRITTTNILHHYHTIISGSSDGTLRLFEPSCLLSKDYKHHKFSEVSVIRKLNPMEGEIIQTDNLGSKFPFVFVYATRKNKIHIWDIRNKCNFLNFQIPIELGLITNMCVDKENSNWITITTSTGYVQCWDLRFSIPFQTWQINQKTPSPIKNVLNYGKHQMVILCGDNQASIWDIRDGEKKKNYRILRPTEIPIEDQILSAWVPNNLSYLITAGSSQTIRYWDDTIANSYIINSPLNSLKAEYSVFASKKIEMFSENQTSKVAYSLIKENWNSIVQLNVLQEPEKLLIAGTENGVVKIFK